MSLDQQSLAITSPRVIRRRYALDGANGKRTRWYAHGDSWNAYGDRHDISVVFGCLPHFLGRYRETSRSLLIAPINTFSTSGDTFEDVGLVS